MEKCCGFVAKKEGLLVKGGIAALDLSENLAKYRKRCGLTQGQLAAKLCVTPQAVSKWENGSRPDSEYLPALSQILGVSLDVLFGLAEEQEEPDLEQLIANKIRHTPAQDRADVLVRLFYAAMSAYQDYTLSKIHYPQKLELETFAELKTDHEMALARLNDNLRYFCFMEVPEDGVNTYTDASDEVVRLFQTLADAETIRIIHYLGAGIKNRMQSLGMIAKRLELPMEKVSRVMDRLDRLGLVWRVSAEITDEPSIIYGYVNSTPLTFILTLARSLTGYLRFHDLYIDQWEQGPFRMPNVANSSPIPQIGFWETDADYKK